MGQGSEADSLMIATLQASYIISAYIFICATPSLLFQKTLGPLNDLLQHEAQIR